jgi:hypothetical protein
MRLFLATQVGYLAFAYAHALATGRLTRDDCYVSAALDDPLVASVTKVLVLVGGADLLRTRVEPLVVAAIVLSFATADARISLDRTRHLTCAGLTFLLYVLVARDSPYFSHLLASALALGATCTLFPSGPLTLVAELAIIGLTARCVASRRLLVEVEAHGDRHRL